MAKHISLPALLAIIAILALIAATAMNKKVEAQASPSPPPIPMVCEPSGSRVKHAESPTTHAHIWSCTSWNTFKNGIEIQQLGNQMVIGQRQDDLPIGRWTKFVDGLRTLEIQFHPKAGVIGVTIFDRWGNPAKEFAHVIATNGQPEARMRTFQEGYWIASEATIEDHEIRLLRDKHRFGWSW